MRNLLSEKNDNLKSRLDKQIMENKVTTRMYEELQIKVRHEFAQVAICM